MKSKSHKQSNNCPLCKGSVLHFEGDQFCVACDWNTMFADIQSGRFEKRLGLTKPAKPKPQPSVAAVADTEIIHENTVAASA